MNRHRWRASAVLCSLSMMLLLAAGAGCAALGYAAYVMPKPDIQPEYQGLRDQTIGVMVWADRGIRIDFPTIQQDLANAIQNKLIASQGKEGAKDPKESKARTIRGATFPVQPLSIVRYQKDHPEIEAMNITDVAPKLGVSRLIYVEMDDFATRSVASVELFRGRAKCVVHLVEIDPSGKATVAYNKPGVQVLFPKKAPAEGVPGGGDEKMYMGTIDALSTEIANLFIPHQPDED